MYGSLNNFKLKYDFFFLLLTHLSFQIVIFSSITFYQVIENWSPIKWSDNSLHWIRISETNVIRWRPIFWKFNSPYKLNTTQDICKIAINKRMLTCSMLDKDLSFFSLPRILFKKFGKFFAFFAKCCLQQIKNPIN